MSEPFSQSYDEQIGNLVIKLGLAKKEDVDKAIEDITQKVSAGKSNQVPSGETPSQLYESVIDLLIERGQIDPDKLSEVHDALGKTAPSVSRPVTTKLLPMTQVGRYILTSKIGRGGMGEVWRAWDPMLRTYVALKFLLASLDETDLKRFINEARTVAALDHPNIANVLSVDEWNGRHYIAMKFIKGKNLDRIRGEQALKPREICELVRDAAMTIHHAHSLGFIHRDIKPANIMVDATKRVYVLDFGLAKSAKSDIKLSRSDVIIGTLPYMSPEQVSGNVLDHRTDIYSLGVVLYELMCGRLPFSHHDHLLLMDRIKKDEPIHPMKLDKSIDRDLAVIIAKSMEKDPDRRYQTVREMAEDIDRYVHGEPIQARPSSIIYKLKKKIKKNPLLYVSIVCAIVIGVVSFLLIGHLLREAEREERDRILAERESQKLLAERERLEKANELRKRLDQLLEPAKLAARKGDVENAKKSFEQALLLLNQDKTAFSCYFKGEVLLEMEKYEEALAEFEKALGMDSRILEAKIGRGIILAEKYEAGVSRFLQAEKYKFAGSSKLGDDWEEKWKQFATTEIAEKSVPELKNIRERLLQDLSLDLQSQFLPKQDLLFARAILSFTSRNLQDAKKYANETINIAVSHHRAYNLLARIALEGSKLEEAFNNVDLSLKYHVSFAPSYVLLTSIYLLKGKEAKELEDKKKNFLLAVESADKAIKFGQDLSSSHTARQEAYLLLASVENRIGKKAKLYDTAIKSSTEAINRDPKNFKLYYDRAYANFSKAITDETALNIVSEIMKLVIADVDEVLRLNPHYLLVSPFKENYFVQAALKAEGLGKNAELFYDEAIKELDKLIELFTDIPILYFRRASLYKRKAEYINIVHTALGRSFADSLNLRETCDKAINDYLKCLGKGLQRAIDYRDLGITRIMMSLDPKLRTDEVIKILDQAIDDLTKSIGLDNKDSESYASRANSYVDKARSALKSADAVGFWKKAIDDYSNQITLKPDMYAYIYRGEARFKTGDDSGAIDDYTKAINIAPTNSLPYFYRAYAYNALGENSKANSDFIRAYNASGRYNINQKKYLKAAKEFEAAISIDSDCIEAYINLSDAQIALGKFTEALQTLGKAISINPKHVEALKSLGTLQMDLDSFSEALKNFELAMKNTSIEKEKSSILFLRGECYMKIGNYESATHDLTDYIDSNPKDPIGYILRGRVYRLRGKLDQAVENLSTALKLREDSSLAFYERALTKWKKVEFKDAISDYTNALECDPFHKDSLYWRGFLYLQAGEVNNALTDLKNKQGGNSAEYLLLAKAQEAGKYFQDAISSYTKAIDLNPQNKEAYLARAKVLKQFGDTKAANVDETFAKTLDEISGEFSDDRRDRIIKLTESILSNPNNANLYNYRGILRREHNQYRSALRDFTKAVELDPNNAFFLIQRGITRMELKDYEGAIRDLKRALQLDPKNSKTCSILSSLYSSRSESEFSEQESIVFAIDYLTKAIGIEPQDAKLYQRRGSIAQKLGDFLLAEQDFTTAIKLAAWWARPFNDRAYLYEKMGRLEEALKDLGLALEKEPKLKLALEDRSRVKNTLGKFAESISDLSLLIGYYPDENLYYLKRAKLYTRAEKYDQAISDYNTAIKLDRYSPPFAERAKVYELKSDWKSALADYDNAINFASSSTYISKGELSELYLFRSYVWEKLGNDGNGLSDATRSVELADKDNLPKALARRGLLRLKKGDDQGAEKDFELVNNSHIPLSEVLFKYAELLKKKDKKIDTSNIDWRANYLKGREFYSNKNYKEAIEYFTKAIALKSDNLVTLLERGTAYLESGNIKDALADFDVYLGRSKDHIVLNYIGLARMKSGEVKEAVESFKNALSIKPFESEILYNIARACALAKDNTAALNHLKEAIVSGFRNISSIEKDKEFSELQGKAEWNAIIDSIHILKTLEEILPNEICNNFRTGRLADLIKRYPDSDLLLYARGRINMLCGDFANAAQDFKSALDKNPSFIHSRHMYASMLWELKKHEEARKIFDKLEGIAKDNPISELGFLHEAYSENFLDDVINVCNRLDNAGIGNQAPFIYWYRAMSRMRLNVKKNHDLIMNDLEKLAKIDSFRAYDTYLTFSLSAFKSIPDLSFSLAPLNEAVKLIRDKGEGYAYIGALNDLALLRSSGGSISQVIENFEKACIKRVGGEQRDFYGELFKNTEKIVAGRKIAALFADEITEFDKGLKRELPNLLVERGRMRNIYGDHGGAERDLTEALSLDSSNKLALLERAFANWKLNKYTDGIHDCTLVIQQDGKNKLAFVLRAQCRYGLRNLQLAIDDATAALKIDPNNLLAYIVRAACYFEEEKDDKALNDYEKAVGLNPKYVEGYTQSARIYILKGNFDKAISLATKAIDMAEIPLNQASALKFRGMAYYYKKEWARALNDLEDAVELNKALEPELKSMIKDCKQKKDLD